MKVNKVAKELIVAAVVTVIFEEKKVYSLYHPFIFHSVTRLFPAFFLHNTLTHNNDEIFHIRFV